MGPDGRDDAALVVLGAGPAGLAGALGAARRGLQVVVLEQADRVGGMAASLDVAGRRVDLGSHRLHPAADPSVLALLAELLGSDLQVRPRNGRIRLGGRWVGFPLRAVDLLTALPPRFAVAAARDAALAPLRRPLHDSYRDVVRAGLGPTVSEAFYEPYARKLWGVEPDRLSGDLARRRVGTRSPLAVIRRLRRAADPAGRTFLYPRRGFGQISEALAAAVDDLGVEVRTGTPVTGVARDGDRWRVTTGDGGVRWAPAVWSTVPVRVLADLLDPGPPADVRAAAGRLRTRGMALVYLALEEGPYTPFDAHYLPDPGTVVSRLSEPRNYRDGHGPDGDPPTGTVLCAEVPCSVGDATWDLPDDVLADLVATELEGLGLPPLRPTATDVIRLPSVYPVYDLDSAPALAELEGWLATRPDLLTLGRQGLFVPDNTHHAIAMGLAAADCLRADGTVDRAAWARAREGFRAHVVED